MLTCTGVSFAHGSNDGQKGMGLIMLILIGCVPTAYALNRAMPDSRVEQFHTLGAAAQTALQSLAPGTPPADGRAAVTQYIRTKQLQPDTVPAVAELVSQIDAQVNEYGTLRKIPKCAEALNMRVAAVRQIPRAWREARPSPSQPAERLRLLECRPPGAWDEMQFLGGGLFTYLIKSHEHRGLAILAISDRQPRVGLRHNNVSVADLNGYSGHVRASYVATPARLNMCRAFELYPVYVPASSR